MATPSETIVPTGGATPVSVLRTSLRRARLLTPTFGDLQFLSVLVWIFAVGPAAWSRLLVDADAGWHIRTGQWILQNASVPRTDFYSFTKPGQEWFAWEWLAEIILGGLFLAGGLKAVVLLSAILVAAFGALIFQHAVWRGANVFIALPLVLMAVGASTVHALARPHLWTMAFFALSWFLIDRDRRSPSLAIWWLVPLGAAWTNLHGGFLALPVMLGLVAAGSALEAWFGERCWKPTKRYAILAAATAAVSLINPYGWRLHLHVRDLMQTQWVKDVVSEWMSPTFRNEQMLLFEILLLAGMAVSGWLISRRRFVEPLLLVFWAHSALGSARHLTLYCAAAVPVIAAALAELWDMWTRKASRNSTPAILADMARSAQPSLSRISVWAILPLVAIAFIGQPLRWPQDFPAEIFPVEMIDQNVNSVKGLRVFTTDQWADYLLFRFYPDQRVFLDGRCDFYGEHLGKEYLSLLNGAPDWSRILDKYQFDTVLIPADRSLGSLLKLCPDWRLLADDGKRLLFRRIGPGPESRKTRSAA